MAEPFREPLRPLGPRTDEDDETSPRDALSRREGEERPHFALPLAAMAGLGHLQLGTVDFVLLGSLLVGSLPGIYLGSRVGTKLPDPILRPVLGGVLLVIGVGLMIRG